MLCSSAGCCLALMDAMLAAQAATRDRRQLAVAGHLVYLNANSLLPMLESNHQGWCPYYLDCLLNGRNDNIKDYDLSYGRLLLFEQFEKKIENSPSLRLRWLCTFSESCGHLNRELLELECFAYAETAKTILFIHLSIVGSAWMILFCSEWYLQDRENRSSLSLSRSLSLYSLCCSFDSILSKKLKKISLEMTKFMLNPWKVLKRSWCCC